MNGAAAGGFIERRPILSCLLILLVASPGMMIASVLIPSDPFDVWAWEPILRRAVPTLVFLLVLWRKGWLRAAGFNGPGRWREPWLVWLPALMILLNPLNLLGRQIVPAPDWSLIAGTLAQGVSIALFEETAFRGLILAILLNRFHRTRAEVIGAVFGSSLLFAAFHLPTNPYWQLNAAQWTYAFFSGVGFAAVLLRTRSIWLPIAVHALVYAASVTTNILLTGQTAPLGEVQAIADPGRLALATTLVTLPVFLYGMYLLRPGHPLETGFGAQDRAAGT